MPCFSNVPHSVFDSPALPLLCELEEAATAIGVCLEATVTADGRLRVGPREILTPSRVSRIQQSRDALRVLIWIADSGMLARRDVFRLQLASYTGRSVVPALQYVAGVRPEPGVCISCGGRMTAPTWCGRCQLAARLALYESVPDDWTPAVSSAVAEQAVA